MSLFLLWNMDTETISIEDFYRQLVGNESEDAELIEEAVEIIDLDNYKEKRNVYVKVEEKNEDSCNSRIKDTQVKENDYIKNKVINSNRESPDLFYDEESSNDIVLQSQNSVRISQQCQSPMHFLDKTISKRVLTNYNDNNENIVTSTSFNDNHNTLKESGNSFSGKTKAAQKYFDNENTPIEENIESKKYKNSFRNDIINKRLREQGKEYKGWESKKRGKMRSSREMGPTCTSSRCAASKKFKCNIITEEQRKNLHRKFWCEMSWEQKKVYISTLVQQLNVCHRVGENMSRKGVSFQYGIKIDNGVILPVCKKMFLSTFSLGEWSVHNWVKNSDKGMHESHHNRNQKCQRKKKEFSSEYKFLSEFLDSLPILPSHYCRKTSNMKYLEPTFGNTKSDLYAEYKKRCENDTIYKHKPLSHTIFYKAAKNKKLSFIRPKKDMCDKCISYKAKNIAEEQYADHIKKKQSARAEKENDKNKIEEENGFMLCVDVQAVQLCPMLNASALYYKTKLCCHNYTVYDVSSRKCVCYWFDETDADLSSNTFASCLIDYITNKCRGAKEIIIWSDNCSYQNKNATLSNALLHYAIENKVVIYQKYLEKGHTQMEVDSVHSTIERRLKNNPIYLPNDYCEHTKKAKKVNPYNVQRVSYEFTKNFNENKIYKSIRPGRTCDMKVNNIKAIKYNQDGIKAKLAFDNEWIALPIKRGMQISKTLPISNFKQLNEKPFKIEKTKWNHLQQLKEVIPKDYHWFYDNLPHK